MNKMRYDNEPLAISDITDFSLSDCLTSGQAFRWRPQGEGFFGVALGRTVYAEQQGDTLYLQGASAAHKDAFLRYFDLKRDYAEVKARYADDPFLCEGMQYAPGMRVLNQPPFETLISFIISANNNVKRISGIVETLCMRYGAPIGDGYDFPTPETLAACSEDELKACGAGYRARYIVGAAQAVADGYDLYALARKPFEQARQELVQLPGVGLKVADCVCLYALGFAQAFPADVWMRRVLCGIYGYSGRNDKQMRAFVDAQFGQWAGLAQQYLFHYARHHKEAVCAAPSKS